MHSDREKLVERLRERAEYHSRKGADYGSTRPLSDNELKTAELLREAIAALAAEPQAVPEGMVLVPKEPTPGMLIEGWDNSPVDWSGRKEDLTPIYAAMLAASPAVQGGDHGE